MMSAHEHGCRVVSPLNFVFANPTKCCQCALFEIVASVAVCFFFGVPRNYTCWSDLTNLFVRSGGHKSQNWRWYSCFWSVGVPGDSLISLRGVNHSRWSSDLRLCVPGTEGKYCTHPCSWEAGGNSEVWEQLRFVSWRAFVAWGLSRDGLSQLQGGNWGGGGVRTSTRRWGVCGWRSSWGWSLSWTCVYMFWVWKVQVNQNTGSISRDLNSLPVPPPRKSFIYLCCLCHHHDCCPGIMIVCRK